MEIVYYAAYISLIVVLSLVINWGLSSKRKKKAKQEGRGLENQSAIYQGLLDIYNKKESFVYDEDINEQYKEVLNGNEDELYHAKNAIQSDLETEGVVSIIYTVFNALVSVFFAMISESTASSMSQILDINIESKIIENLLTIYFLIATVSILRKSMNTCRSEKFFLCMIEDAIEERKQRQVIVEENLRAELEALRVENQTLKVQNEMLEKQKKKFGIHITIDK